MRERSQMVLADLIQIRAEQTPDLDVLTFEHLSLDGCATPDEVRTFADLQRNANRIAAGLLEEGIAVGDRIALLMRNHPEFVEGMIASSILGALFVPVDPRTRGEKLVYMLRNSGCAGVICADTSLAELTAVRDQVPDLRFIFALETGEDAPPISSCNGLLPLAEVLAKPAETLDVRAEGPVAPLQIMYTSGTTGDPKGIVGANFRFCAAAMLADIFGYQPDERPYTGLSFTHGNAQSVTLAPALVKSRGSGTSAAVMAARATRSSAAWRRPSTASRRGLTTPTTRCGWSSPAERRRRSGNPSRSASACASSSSTGPWTAAGWPTSPLARAPSAPSASPWPASR
jgi:crotonobetaine/carnitine-CoA ligase